MQPRRHQKIPRAFGAAGSNNRRLKLAKALVPHPLTHRGNNVAAQFHAGLHFLAAQIQIAIFQPGFFRIFLLAKHLQRQFGRRPQHFDVAHKNLDLAGGDFRIDQISSAGLHLAVNPDAPFAAQFFNLGKGRRVRITQKLGNTVMIAQVDEQNATVIAHPVHPA